MIVNSISFKANPIQKSTKVVKDTVDKVPGFHDYVGAKTIFPSKVAKAAEEANKKALAQLTEDTVEFTNARLPHGNGIASDADEFIQLNKEYAAAQNKTPVVHGVEIKE